MGPAPAVPRPVAVLPVHEEFLLHWVLQRPTEILPAAEEAAIVDWLTHPGVKRIVSEALEAHRAGEAFDAARAADELSDPAFKDKIAELCVKDLPIDVEDLKRGAVEQTLLGIKQKNMNFVVRRLQGEIARLNDEGGDPAVLAKLLMQKVQLNKEIDLIRRQTSGVSRSTWESVSS